MKVKATQKKANSLLRLENLNDVQAFLQKPTIAIAEFLTGVLANSGIVPASYSLSAGRLVQATVKGRLLSQLGKEIEKYRGEGKIKEDYFATNKNQAILLEFLQFIDSDIPDDEVFKALKSIFLSSIEVDADARKEEIAYQFLRLCKKLNSMEILILKTCYRIYKGEDTKNVNTGITAHGDWVNTVSEKIGYGLPELIYTSDDRLVEFGLLSPRSYADKSGIRAGQDFRLTKLSIKLCEFITKWE